MSSGTCIIWVEEVGVVAIADCIILPTHYMAICTTITQQAGGAQAPHIVSRA